MRIDFSEVFQASSQPQFRPDRTVGTGAPAALKHARLSKAIPRKFLLEPESPKKEWLYLASAIAQSFTLPVDLVEQGLTGEITPLDFAGKAARAMINEKCSGLSHIHVDVAITDSYNCYGLDDVLDRCGVEDGAPHLFLITSDGRPRGHEIREMEPVFNAMKSPAERALYFRAMRLLDRARYRFADVVTPAHCLHLVCVQHWHWNYSEIGYFKQLYESEAYDQLDEVRNHGIEGAFPVEYTMEVLKRKLGPTIFSTKGPVKLSKHKIHAIRASGSTAAAAIADAVLAMEEYISSSHGVITPSLEDTDQESIGVSAVLRWNDADDTIKIYDDYANWMVNSGANVTDDFGVTAYQMDSFESAANFVSQINAMCIELTLLDKLIAAISINPEAR